MAHRASLFRNIFLVSISSLILLTLFLPLEWLKYLSIEIVGEPPINGESWMEGVNVLGGSISMRLLAICGLIILGIVGYKMVIIEEKELPPRKV
jgi:hypothetical protein